MDTIPPTTLMSASCSSLRWRGWVLHMKLSRSSVPTRRPSGTKRLQTSQQARTMILGTAPLQTRGHAITNIQGVDRTLSDLDNFNYDKVMKLRVEESETSSDESH